MGMSPLWATAVTTGTVRAAGRLRAAVAPPASRRQKKTATTARSAPATTRRGQRRRRWRTAGDSGGPCSRRGASVVIMSTNAIAILRRNGSRGDHATIFNVVKPLDGIRVVDLTRILAGPHWASLSRGVLRRTP